MTRPTAYGTKARRVGTCPFTFVEAETFSFSRDLIEEFRGSVYLKVFDERGHLVVGPDS